MCGTWFEIKFTDAFICEPSMTETKLRTIARGLTYRFFGILITAVWTGLEASLMIHVILSVLYYIHERLWLKVKWGRE